MKISQMNGHELRALAVLQALGIIDPRYKEDLHDPFELLEPRTIDSVNILALEFEHELRVPSEPERPS